MSPLHFLILRVLKVGSRQAYFASAIETSVLQQALLDALKVLAEVEEESGDEYVKEEHSDTVGRVHWGS